MTAPIRVFIVDDSLIVRRLVEDSLREVDGIAVVGTASNGRQALERLRTTTADVVTLDVEMPELDGLATLRRIRAEHPRVHVLMFSSLTTRSAAASVEALANGAADVVAKPSTSGMTATRASIRDELVPKLRALFAPARPAPIALAPRRADARASIVAIGASTGGPAALQSLLERLPALAAPVVIVQHIPPLFSRMLAERLSTPARAVREAVSGAALHPGSVWLAPGDRHVVVRGHALELDDGPPCGSCKPSVDVLFRSVAEQFGRDALAVVLTGMGRDGVDGAAAIHRSGGRVIAQDEASSVVWGMPGAVARAGLADLVAPLASLASEIANVAQREPREVARARG